MKNPKLKKFVVNLRHHQSKSNKNMVMKSKNEKNDSEISRKRT